LINSIRDSRKEVSQKYKSHSKYIITYNKIQIFQPSDSFFIPTLYISFLHRPYLYPLFHHSKDHFLINSNSISVNDSIGQIKKLTYFLLFNDLIASKPFLTSPNISLYSSKYLSPNLFVNYLHFPTL
jgi:hypothetical protein